MKSLKTLIRMQQREIDLLRREMVKLEERKQSYLDRMEALDGDLRHELETAGELTEMRGFFGDFSETIKQKQQDLSQRVLYVEQQIQKMNIEISKQFAELKKYEIAYERFLERERKERERKEQIELDEIGQVAYLRGEDECV